MFLTMIKSRFMSVGMDNSDQFEDFKMGLLANRIIKHIDLDMPNVEAFYVNKERLVQVQGVIIKVCFPEREFKLILEKQPVSES